MILFDGNAPSPFTEIDRVDVTADQVDAFIRCAQSPAAPAPAEKPLQAPLTFALALRRGHGPDVTISPDAFAIHGGHDIVRHAPIEIAQSYAIRGRIERVFEKTGRSGPMKIVERYVRIETETGSIATEIRDRQIVRWRPTAKAQVSAAHSKATKPHSEVTTDFGGTGQSSEHFDVGDTLGPMTRRGPTGPEISSWANSLRDRETLFHDKQASVDLGYADLVVPGPMQSAFIDFWLRDLMPEWELQNLSMTFRQSLIAGDPLRITAVVVDESATTRTLDITVENASSNELTSSGTCFAVHRKE